MINIVLFAITLFIFLFCFYLYARDDYYFIRKGITLEQLFNVLFIGLFLALFIGRLTYALLNLSMQWLNPLIFFLIMYFPGISLFGFVVGLFMGYIYLTKRRRIHTKRYLDYVSLALLSAFPVGLLTNYFSQENNDIFSAIYPSVMYAVLFLFFIKVLFPKFMRGSLKDGTISLLFLIMFSLVSLLHDVLLLFQNETLLRTEDFLFIALFFIAALLLVRFEIKRPTKTP